MTSPQFVLVTGDSEGLGNATARWVLRRCPHVELIGVSRRPSDQVVGWNELSGAERARYHRVRADFSDDSDCQRAADAIVERVSRDGGTLRSAVLANGTGFLDSQVRSDPSLHALMERLNVTAPLSLLSRLEQSPQIFPATSRVFYYSGVVTHPSITDPLLRMHAALKKKAVEELRRQRNGTLTVVMPGAYMTDMFRRTMRRKDALLEWYALPVADPHAPGGLMDRVARLAVTERGRFPATMIRPRISKLLVTLLDAERLLATLPGSIVRCARAVLHQTDQTDDDHDERVAHLRDHQIYGATFPYDRIVSARLWSRRRSLAYARTLDALALTR